jgi:hypothetical protein
VWQVYAPIEKQGYVTGDAHFATTRVQAVIDVWCEQHPATCPSKETKSMAEDKSEFSELI